MSGHTVVSSEMSGEPRSGGHAPPSSTTEKRSGLEAFVLDLCDEQGSECEGADLTYRQHLLAGGIAGITEHCSVYPIDTVKTRLQMSGSTRYSGVIDCCRSIAVKEGTGRFFRGVSAMALGAGPSHAIYFAVYEHLRIGLGADKPGHHPLANGVAGACGTMMGDAIFAPMDTAKQRLQAQSSPYRNLPDTLSQMIRQEGLASLFASYRTTLFMNVPFTIAQFGSYNSFKEVLRADELAAGSVESVLAHWVCGGASGGLAALVTNPLDVIRTEIQTQGLQGRQTQDTRFKGIVDAGRNVLRNQGMAGFTRGWLPRVMYHVPGAAICWTTYEYVKDLCERGVL